MVKGTDRPAMTIAVDMGRKATKTNKSDHNTDFLILYSVQLKNMYSYLNSSLKLSDIVRGLSCQQSYCY